MTEKTKVKVLEEVVVRFSGDSGDGMQLAGNIFSNVSAGIGDEISTFPDYPAEIRAPQGTLGGVSGFQVHIGKGVHTPGDLADVLVAMNPAALKTNACYVKKGGVVIIDSDSFRASGRSHSRGGPFSCTNRSGSDYPNGERFIGRFGIG